MKIRNLFLLARCLSLSCAAALVFPLSAQGAIIWDATSDLAATGAAPTGTTFQTQTFTPSGSIQFGSYHTATDLANITLNFDGLSVNGGGARVTDWKSATVKCS